MLCSNCKIRPVSTHEVEHCDECADTIRARLNLAHGNKIIYTVQILSCANPSLYWYHNKINDLFDCELLPNDSAFWPSDVIYKTVNAMSTVAEIQLPAQRANILPQDCKVIDKRQP